MPFKETTQVPSRSHPDAASGAHRYMIIAEGA